MTARILIGDCRVRMAELADASVDSVVCDPPYHLTSIVKRFGAENAAPAKVGKTGAYARASKGFMGQTWDGGDVAFDPETWVEVLRVLKPGGHLIAFSGTRTYHRMAVAIEDAGFEIRDQLGYCYGSGFPKSHNVKKGAREAVCRCPAGDDQLCSLRQGADDASGVASEGESPDLLPAMQRCPARPGVGEARPQGLGGEEAETGYEDGTQPRMEGRGDVQASEGELQRRPLREGSGMGEADGESGRLHHGASASDGSDVRLPADEGRSGEPQGSQAREQSAVQLRAVADERGPQAWGGWPVCDGCGKPIIPEGLGTALKPAWEPICLARKPLDGTVAGNVLKHGTGALNIDGCRIETNADEPNSRANKAGTIGGCFIEGDKRGVAQWDGTQGRWPANLCHDGSEEVLAGFPETESGAMRAGTVRNVANRVYGDGCSAAGKAATERDILGDSGSAARFFYCAKTTTEERGEGNNHPTVKPIALMRWLCRLVTPKGGTILDPFMGSGSTLLAAEAEQFNAIGCEMSPDYAAIAERRLRDAGGMFADVSVCLGEAA